MISPETTTKNKSSKSNVLVKHTQNLLMSKAHDVHGLHGLLEVVFVLLARDWDVTVGQETVVIETFQKKVRCGKKNGKTFRNMVKM